MKICALLVVAVATAACLTTQAQTSELAIFSDDGRSFQLYVNGKLQNTVPASNVVASDIRGEGCVVRIVFDAATDDAFTKPVILSTGNSHAISIQKNKKGQYTLKMAGVSPLTQTKTPVLAQSRVETSESSGTAPSTAQKASAQSTTATTRQTTVSESGMPAENISLGVSVPGSGINVSFNVGQTGVQANSTVSTYSSTVTTTSNTTTSSTATPDDVAPTVVVDCQLTTGSYNNLVRSIQEKPYEDTKFSTARLGIKGKCVTVDQVAGLVRLFNYEDTRLDFAKYAYDFVSDIDEYYRVADAFNFEATKGDLLEFIESKQ